MPECQTIYCVAGMPMARALPLPHRLKSSSLPGNMLSVRGAPIQDHPIGRQDRGQRRRQQLARAQDGQQRSGARSLTLVGFGLATLPDQFRPPQILIAGSHHPDPWHAMDFHLGRRLPCRRSHAGTGPCWRR